MRLFAPARVFPGTPFYSTDDDAPFDLGPAIGEGSFARVVVATARLGPGRELKAATLAWTARRRRKSSASARRDVASTWRRVDAASPPRRRRVTATSPPHRRRIAAASPPRHRRVTATSPPRRRRERDRRDTGDGSRSAAKIFRRRAYVDDNSTLVLPRSVAALREECAVARLVGGQHHCVAWEGFHETPSRLLCLYELCDGSLDEMLGPTRVADDLARRLAAGLLDALAWRGAARELLSTSRGDAAAATWIIRGDQSRRRRGGDVDNSRRPVAATPRRRRG